MRRGLVLGTFLVLAAILAGCGGSGPDGGSSTAATRTNGSQGPRQRSSSESTSPSARGLPRCRDSALVVRPEAGKSSVAAGTVYHQMTITNLSRRACSLSGYPSVVVIGRGGEVIGKSTPVPKLKPTNRNPRRLVGLARLAGSAHFMLTYNDGTAAGPCRFATSFGLRVRLPGGATRPDDPLLDQFLHQGGMGSGCQGRADRMTRRHPRLAVASAALLLLALVGCGSSTKTVTRFDQAGDL
jgi:hypothetical protein